MSDTVNAAFYRRYGPPDVLQLGAVARPEAGPGQVLVSMETTGISPIDCKLRSGVLAGRFSLPFPKTPGRDGIGRVIALGAGTSGFSIGERVAVMLPRDGRMGTAAGELAVDSSLAAAVPAGLGAAEANALVLPGISALIALRTAGVRAGQRVLIQGGAGAVGGVLVQLCAMMGAEVTATAKSSNAGYLESLGAAHAVPYDSGATADLPPQHVVFDLVGGSVHDSCYRLLIPGGHLVWLNAAPFEDRGKEFGVLVKQAPIEDDMGAASEIMQMAARGALRSQVAGVLPIHEIADAHRRQEAGTISRGRLVLTL